MNKRTRIIVLIGVAAVAVYLIYRYIQNRGNANSGTGALGSNLNSVAPELIGGSSGPAQGPAVSVPVNITLTTQDSTSNRNSRNEPIRYGPANPVGMNTPVSASATGTDQSPMRSAAVSRHPMKAQHRAAGHPEVTSQSMANMAASASGATKPSVPSPSSYSSRHSGGQGAKPTGDVGSDNRASAAKHVTSGGTGTGSKRRGRN